MALSWARVGVQPVVPYLMPVEVANALYRRVVRVQMSLDVAIRLLDALVESGIQLREPSVYIEGLPSSPRSSIRMLYTTPTTWRLLSCLTASFGPPTSVFSGCQSLVRTVKWLGSFRDNN